METRTERMAAKKKGTKEKLPLVSAETKEARLYLSSSTVASPDDDDSLVVGLDIESITCLFVYEHLQRPKLMQITLVENDEGWHSNLFSDISLDKETVTHICCIGQEAPAESKFAKLPAIVLVDDDGATTVISGLSSVCRTIVQLSGQEEILGFKRGCLAAPAEASVWTKFCEIDVLRFIERLMRRQGEEAEELEELDAELARFEMHLKQPVRIHNFAKVIQDMRRKEVVGDSLEKAANDTVAIKHQFVEGPKMFLADLILFSVFYFVFRRLTKEQLKDLMPLTVAWYEEMQLVVGSEVMDKLTSKMVSQRFSIKYSYSRLSPLPFQSISTVWLKSGVELPATEYVSLYKSDPKRYKPRKRIFTRQSDIEGALQRIALFPVDMTNENPETPGKRLTIDWSSAFGMPEAGDLPQSRLDRKQQQLKSMAQQVIYLARPGDVIVDFCSGSGHLGLLVASMLPSCQVVLLENKAESLDRAKARAKETHLSNLVFLQTNLDYFRGHFDIGLSLHACGVATDIVMWLCIEQKAHFVCCPCCYGAVLDMPHITYPRSEFFRQPLRRGDEDATRLTAGQYFCIAHGSDQSHAEGTANTIKEKRDQGQLCMDIIDYDRRRYAEEQGYQVTATKLEPVDCTQKNRLLIGRHVGDCLKEVEVLDHWREI